MIGFVKKYWLMFLFLILIFSLICTKKYQIKRPGVTYILTEPIWMYWIHKATSGAELLDE